MVGLWCLVFFSGIAFIAAGFKCRDIAKAGVRKWGSAPWQWSATSTLCFYTGSVFVAAPLLILLILTTLLA